MPSLDGPLKLSVVIPCLNAEATIGGQLAALCGQSWPGEWEVIVADNGSRDRSREIVESYRGRLSGLQLVDASDRKGQARARNLGAAAATGDALLFCDADDEVAPGWLEALGHALAVHEFVACRYDNETLNPAWTRRTHLNPQRDGLTSYDYPPFLPHAGGGGLAVRRRVHEEVGGFDETLPALEDTDYCWRIQLAGHGFHFVPEAVVRIRHRHDPASIYRQGVSYGKHNVLIYQRYQGRGMPRLGVLPGLLRWGKLILKTPWMLLTREGRARWLWQLGWRVGRIRGCWEYRVVAP
jgi:glycosyltransferase involved in cell wall biosynthesis